MCRILIEIFAEMVDIVEITEEAAIMLPLFEFYGTFVLIVFV